MEVLNYITASKLRDDTHAVSEAGLIIAIVRRVILPFVVESYEMNAEVKFST